MIAFLWTWLQLFAVVLGVMALAGAVVWIVAIVAICAKEGKLWLGILVAAAGLSLILAILHSVL